MSPLLTSQGMALATAMAVSGTVIVFALCRQKPLLDARFAVHPDSPSAARNLRSCIASGGMRKSKKKRVHFADHLVEAVELIAYEDESDEEEEEEEKEEEEEEYDDDYRYDTGSGFDAVRVSREDPAGGMPANRLALYNGILQDRLQRMTCSY